MSGHLTPKDLQVALEAQSMLRDHTIDINIAVQCIKVARKIGASFADVLEDYDASAAKRARTGKLGELLVDASIISQDQLSQAMEQGLNTGMPLGRMLVLNEAIQAEFLEKALDIQVRLRDEMLTREEAIKSLQELAGVEATAGKEEEKKPEKKKQIVRLGELLVMAGILSENDVMDALEWGLANQQPIGTVLVSQQLISQELLDAALFFQTCVKSDELDPLKACECLSEVFSTGVSPEEALKEVTDSATIEAPDKPPIDYRTLVKMARVVTDEDIDKAFDITAHDAALIGKVLVLTGFMDVPTLQATLRCYQMVSKGWLSPDDAIAALDYCLHQSQSASPSFEQALRDLKWSPESGLKMRGEKNLMKQTRENMAALSAGKLTAPEPVQEVEPEPEPIPVAREVVEEEEESVVPKSLLAALAVKSMEEETVSQPEPEPEPETEPEPEPEPEPLKVEVPATPPTLDTLLGPLRNGEEPHPEPEPEPESEQVQEQVEEIEEEKVPVAAVAREEETGGGLGALLQGLGGSSDESSRADAPPKKMGGLLGNLIQKSAEPEEAEPGSMQEQEPVKAEAETDALKGLSAEELLAQIEQGSQQQHDSAKGIKRKGRHADTIMPEAAKARQLAALIAKEPSAANKFAGAGAGEQDEDALGEAFERLAERHFEQGNYKEAQVIYERILVHKLNDLGPESPDLIEDYNNLAMTLCIQKFFDRAEPFMKKAVTLYEKKEQKDPLAFADYLHSLGTIHYRLDKLEEAEDEFSRVLEIRKAMLDRDHEDIGRTLTDYAKVVKKLGQNENAEAIYKKAKEILKRNS